MGVSLGEPDVGANKLILALDTSDPDIALRKINELGKYGCGFKLGLESMAASLVGKRNVLHMCVERIKKHGGFVFLDCKLHDIKNTTTKAMEQFLLLEPELINIHGAVGTATMRAVA